MSPAKGKNEMPQAENITVTRTYYDGKLEKQTVEQEDTFTPFETVETAQAAIQDGQLLKVLNAGLLELKKEEVAAKIVIPEDAVSEEAVKAIMKSFVPAEQMKGASLVDARAKVWARIRSSAALQTAIRTIDAELKAGK